MRCSGCGFCITVNPKSVSWKCNVCGSSMLLDAEDFLLHQYGAPGRDVRPEQVKMGVLVEEVLLNQEIALIEAPVGSGKSDGYGIPAFISASDKSKYVVLPTTRLGPKLSKDTKIKRRIVISTAKKNLQHQIAEKDLPYIRQRHGADVKIALFKGKSNYACRFKVDMLKDPDKEKMHAWLDKNKTEDITQYVGVRPPYFGDITAEDCIGSSCAYAQALGGKPPLCGYRRARQEAKDASIIVTNHHVVAQDLKLGPNRLLGAYTALIIDEAHQLPGSLRAAFSEHITQGAPSKLTRLIDRASIEGKFSSTLKMQWDAMFSNVSTYQGELKRDPFGKPAADAVATLDELRSVVTKQATEFGWVENPRDDEESSVSKLSEDEKMFLSNLLSIRKRCEALTSALRSSAEPDANTVIFATQEKQQRTVSVCPINTGPLVGPKLQLIPSIVLTSGTITLNNSFNEIKYQLGLNWSHYAEGTAKHPAKKINELILKTPFDYGKQAFLYTPTHMPMPVGETSPARGAYIAAVVEECARLIEASRGNAFILFTAKKDQEDVYAGLLNKGVTLPLILHSGDAETALQLFKNTPDSTLLGLKSFWEGVDIQGQKLQLVIIPKLPFSSPTDPVVRARTDKCVRELMEQEGMSEDKASKAAFRQVQIPQMLIDLRQGAGRLIRTKSDRGVLAILDPRIFTGTATRLPSPNQSVLNRNGYARDAIDAIGFTNQTIDFDLIAKGLKNWRK